MTTKQKHIDDVKAYLASLENEVEKEARVPNKAQMFVPKEGDEVHWIAASTLPHPFYAISTEHADSGWQQPAFRTRAHAEAMAQALNTEFQMYACDGIVPVQHNTGQWVVNFRGDGTPYATCWNGLSNKLNYAQFGIWESAEALEAAIAKVGPHNLTRAADARIGRY